ncbi:MAG: tRNA dihydrouridine synthase DusB [Bacteroidetes bacterium]|nr:tRNA dihydrouridine synthase DusB [Bacteroidota bacterium]MCL2303249.1 tRNA dihydrouridine synthase DusB [Lentimicrobiaceae bacterium]
MNFFSNYLETNPNTLFLAPMEEITDAAFRRICKTLGADVLVSEFVSSEALIRDVQKSFDKMAFDETERPFGIQIFGHDETSLVKAAQVAEEQRPDFIDINWGCPVKKVVVKGAGAAILKDIPKMVACTKAVVNAVKLPVSVKTRLGWDMNDKPIVSAAEQLQDIGIQAITIHGRTRSQLYSGVADWTLIGEVKNNPRMKIPVIGNGDITSGEKAVLFKQRYGVDALMIGRAAIGNPWVFEEIKCAFTNHTYTSPPLSERINILLQHLKNSIPIKGEKKACLEIRRHYAGYFKGVQDFKKVRLELMKATTLQEIEAIFNY